MSKVDIKVVLLGRHSVGKTCLVERFLHGKFKDNTVATVGAAFGAKKMTVRGKEITLGIWDTAGQERYESMSRIYYRSARAAIICYDLTDKKSWEKVKFWVDELTNNEESCAIYIVGTKVDLVEEGTPRGASAEEVKQFAASVQGKVYETSAKNGNGIDLLFQDIAEGFLGKDAAGPSPSNTINPVKPPTEEPKKGCCG